MSDQLEKLQSAITRQLKKTASADLPAGLYLVATPIGNLADMSIRALTTLAHVDEILCEDTRHSKKLLDQFAIDNKLIAFHEHNEEAKIASVIKKIQAGKRLALISDAGTPLISDPGFKLVRALKEAGCLVSAMPGASAAIMGLSISGLPTDKFYFEGFLPAKSAARKARLKILKNMPVTLIFYESPRRVAAMVEDCAEIFGPERSGAIARELTKLYEEVISAPLAQLSAQLATKQLKGEFVVLIKGAEEKDVSTDMVEKALKENFAEGMSLKDNVKDVMALYNLPRSKIYPLALEIKDK